jgi:predicted DNA-binding protein
MATRVLSTTINEVLAEKLDRLAAETHRKKSYYVNQALKEYFEGIADYELALQRKNGEFVALSQAKKELEL